MRPGRREVRLLLTARGIRAFADGFVSILLPVYLTRLGIPVFEIGAITTAMLLGPAVITLAVGLVAHRLRIDRLLTGAAVLMVLSGIGYAYATEFWPLLVIAFVGTLNPTASEVGVFVPLEQTVLSNTVAPVHRTNMFASYSLVGSLVGALGCLFAGAPEMLARVAPIALDQALRGMFVGYALLGAAASLFFWTGLLSAFSYPVAAWLAHRIGLVNTMVFTHLPSNLCLMLVPFAPGLESAIALLLVRSALSQMDVPARTSYVMAVVTPPERPAAASITAVPRSIAGAASPVLAGYLLGVSAFGWPLVIAGAFNRVYDLLFLWMFRRVRPPEEVSDNGPAASPEGGLAAERQLLPRG